ncbi:ral GTPase-activating protein subunit beta-like isoform X2 [Anneissia japonica]|uniref:ral GTPase-activating protein subunit beta-like isoform X2 n=1 Tax=Anneissia japonica TaxID=1529436 RepID=UPI001425954C|nr:ral GTPase-activating protein subunit beta-like isoform X2 [Anneissia japonica]
MYSEWASLQATIENESNYKSVLHSYSSGVGRDVAVSVVRQLAGRLSINASAKHEPLPSNLENEKQIEWTMEVICFGLSLPLIEHEAIRDCVNIYVEWLTALTVPKPTVPPSIVNDPNPYVQKIFQHFVNLFKPRERGDSNKQIVLCHRVLRTVQTIAKQSGKFTRQTWEVLLQFLLAVNDTILSPPSEAGSLSEQLCDRLLSVLFELWLLACTRCFPSPSLWRTFREYCVAWRHHTALIEQWNRVNRVLTSHLLKILYGPHFPEIRISEEDAQIISTEMDDACIAQTWFRFLHILSNPVDLCKPKVVSKTPMFHNAAFSGDAVIEPHQHPCLSALPKNFLLAMKGIASLSNAFIGEPEKNLAVETNPNNKTPPQSVKHSKMNYSTSVYREKPSKSVTPSPLLTPTPEGLNMIQLLQMEKRSQCNSILHLFGAWLFEGAVSGCKLHTVSSGEGSVGGSKPRRVHFAVSSSQSPHGRFPKERHSIAIMDSHRMNGRRIAQASEMRKISEVSPNDITAILAPYRRHDISESPNNYEAGRAEACGALCRIFCNHNQGENILPVYLSRFYLALTQGLKIDETVSGLVLSSILFNSQDLFRIDLKGVSVVLPHFISALEMVLSEKELKFKSGVSQQQLRQASIHHLLSMLCIPHHFNTLSVIDLMTGKPMMTSGVFGENERVVTFRSLKLRIVNLMIGALQCELDPDNTQMLLGAIHLCILDASLCEDIEQKEELKRKEESHRELGSTILEEVMENHQSESSSSKVMTHQRSSSEPIVDLTPLTSGRSPVGPHLDTAWSIFVRCTHLVCQRLMSAWSSEYNVALAALELLSGLAKINVSIVQDQLECKRAVRWICEHIVHLCSRPSQYHSRDLHSIIVAAFQCLTVWIVNHEYLLKDKECLHCVLEVIELGISGSKSRPKGCVPPVYKHEKELKPASMRVKDAAEAVLACLLNHVGSFPSPIGPSSVVSLLDEEAILKLVKEQELATGDVVFRYYVLENNTLLAILEQPVIEEKDPLPTATILLRGLMGRHAWVMQTRHWPKSEKEAAQERLKYPARPQPMDNVGTHHEIPSRNFPEMVDKIQLTDADRSIPTMASIETDTSHAEHEKLKMLLEKQIEYETFVLSSAEAELANVGFPNPRTEAKPPRPKQEFSPARLLLSHLGFLTLGTLKEPANSSVPPSLVMLDSTLPGFDTDLELLDSIPCRTFDTAFIFYVKSGQRTPTEILNNVLSNATVSPQFLEFLNNLGWPVDIATHAGWSGHVSTSWKMDPDVTRANIDLDAFMDHGGSLYNGQHQVLYHADCTSEMAFVVPSKRVQQMDRRHSVELSEQPSSKCSLSPYGSKSLPLYQSPHQRPSTLDLPSETSGPAQVSPSLDKKRKLSTRAGMIGGSQMKVLVVWLECLADGEMFPLSDLLAETSTGLEYLQGNSSSSLRSPRSNDQVAVIFIQPLKSGLYRIQLHGCAANTNPLVDGMVVSRRSLGTLVRQTCVNICNRKRLECDMHFPPHVKRRQKIQEMVSKYRKRLTSPQFYTQLFMN